MQGSRTMRQQYGGHCAETKQASWEELRLLTHKRKEEGDSGTVVETGSFGVMQSQDLIDKSSLGAQ